tara:strand:+ start:2194 stop:3270 length:1077 start_codon:yes stop_codon:yes gene_type:complete
MINSGIVSKSNESWRGHPDVAYFKEHFYVVFRESSAHKANDKTSIKIVKSLDGESYHSEKVIMESEEGRYNCPRLKVINDRMYVICDFVKSKPGQDFVAAENDTENTSIHITCTDDAFHWYPIVETNIRGIVPDRICLTNAGVFLIATHRYDQDLKCLVEDIWATQNITPKWERCATISRSSTNLCEASICIDRNEHLICLMRENSQQGYAALISFSPDGGLSWSVVHPTRLFGCHRPVLGKLRSGNFLVTYREQVSIFQHKYWAKNTFAALIDHRSLVDSPHCNKVNILPIEHDRASTARKGPTGWASASDGGYTGWIQLEGGRIYIVNYVTLPSSMPTAEVSKPFIKWYSLYEEDF